MTGIFGGTFNPIHVGHIQLAEQFCNILHLDEVWFMVTPQNPWKRNNHLIDDSKRLEMVRVALQGHPRLIASDYEYQLPKPNYTYITLRHLREDFPDKQFVLIIGADNWVQFKKWKEYEEILRHHIIAVYPREGYPVDISSLPYNVRFIDTELYPISSTEIREHISRGESVEQLVPPSIIDMLKALYSIEKTL